MKAATVIMSVTLVLASVRAAEPAPPSAKPDFEKLIAQLASTNADESKRAADALADAGEAALNPLRKAETSVNPYLRDKAKAVLLRVVGPAVGGIAVSLSLEKKQLKAGESTHFNLTFWNTSDKDVNMYWGWKTPEYVTDEPADMLVIVNGEGKNRTITGRVYTGPGDERAATSGPVFKTLAPHSGARVKGTVAFVDSFPVNGQTVNTPGLQLSNNSVLALKDLKTPATVRLRYFAEVKPDDRKTEQGKPEKPDAGYWTGTLASNEAEVELKN